MNPEEIIGEIESFIDQIEDQPFDSGSASVNLINLIILFDELAFMLHTSGRMDAAERYYLRSLTLRESHYGLDSDSCIPVMHRLGVLYRVRGRFEHAEYFYNRTLILTAKYSGAASLDVATRSNYLAGLYLAWGKYGRVGDFIASSISIYRKEMGEDHLYVGFCLIALAINQFRRGEKEKAEISLDVADSIIQPLVMLELAPSRASLPALVASLSLIYCRQQKLDEAEILFRYALMQEAREIWPAHPSVGLELEKLSKLYRSQGRIRAADFLVGESQKLRSLKELGERSDPSEIASLTGLQEQLNAEVVHASLKSEIDQVK